jgi:hypothetical protein
MYKRVVSIVITLVLVIGIVIAVAHRHTTLDTTVVDVDSNDVVTVVDSYGGIYSFYGTDYTVGEEIVVVLNNDGEIVATR